FPSLKQKIEEEESGLKARGSPASASSLDLRKVATSSTQRGNAIVTDGEGIKDSGGELRRRHSAGNLREHSEESEDNKHDGEEDTDGDHEMFSMDEAPTPPTTTPTTTIKPKELTSEKIVVPTYAQARQNWAERCYEIERSKRMVHQDTTTIPPTITTTIMSP